MHGVCASAKMAKVADRTNLQLARLLIPPEGIDWGSITRSRRVEAEFLARVEPLLHDDFETVWRHTAGEPEIRTGIDPLLNAIRRVGRSFETFVARPDRYIDLGDSVLVLLRRQGRTVTGLDFDEAGAAVYEFDAGTIRQVVLYASQELALTDAGLSAADANGRGILSDELPEPGA
jgi:ketosteroid isomerase-like protein